MAGDGASRRPRLRRAPRLQAFFASISKFMSFYAKLFQRLFWRFCGFSRGYNRSKSKVMVSKFLSVQVASIAPSGLVPGAPAVKSKLHDPALSLRGDRNSTV